MSRRSRRRGHGRKNYSRVERSGGNSRRIGARQAVIVMLTLGDHNVRSVPYSSLLLLCRALNVSVWQEARELQEQCVGGSWRGKGAFGGVLVNVDRIVRFGASTCTAWPRRSDGSGERGVLGLRYDV